jgi:uncharacterized protein with HEPN domain
MRLEILKNLFDIQVSINSIIDFVGNKVDISEYESNKLLRRAIERELEIIGEAAGRILKIEPTIEITNARKIVDLRNWLIHGYDKVDDIIIWGIIINHIPLLKQEVDILLNNHK